MEGVRGVVALAALVTSVISAVFGMAGGMILMGFYAAQLPVQVAMVLHGVTQLFANGFRAFLLRDRIFGPGLVWYGVGSLASLAFFAWLALVVARPVVFPVHGRDPARALAPAATAGCRASSDRVQRSHAGRVHRREPALGRVGAAARRVLRARRARPLRGDRDQAFTRPSAT